MMPGLNSNCGEPMWDADELEQAAKTFAQGLLGVVVLGFALWGLVMVMWASQQPNPMSALSLLDDQPRMAFSVDHAAGDAAMPRGE